MAETAPPDTTSLMSHVSNLELEKKKMMDKLMFQEQQLEKFTAAERESMKKELESMWDDWLKTIDMSDSKAKEEFLNGMRGIVQKTQKESPIWQVMCCASATHRRNVNELQRITEEYNALKTKVEGGTFRTEEARAGTKRHEPEAPGGGGGGGSRNYWDDFEAEVRGGAVQHYIPDPEKLKELRQEWRPLN